MVNDYQDDDDDDDGTDRPNLTLKGFDASAGRPCRCTGRGSPFLTHIPTPCTCTGPPRTTP
jgi:hypothetical protein